MTEDIRKLKINNMIQSNELRIGNLVYSVGGIDVAPVIKIDAEKIILNEPIPLTENWFNSFGFDHITKNNANYFTHDDDTFAQLRFALIGDTCHVSIGDDNNGTAFSIIKYVHQLQNLFHSVNGEELITKP